MTKKNIIIISVLVLFVAASIAGVKAYSHHCLKKLRMVDSYAVPEVVRFMEVLTEWNFDTLKPFLTKQYINSLSPEEWQAELDDLSILGGLRSFARPGFVTHVPYKKNYICEAAADLYTVSTEFENDNGVVKITFDNTCGKLKVAKVLIFSPSIKVNPELFENVEESKKNPKELLEDFSEDEGEVDLDTLYEYDQEDSLPELDEITEQELEQKVKESSKESSGKIYRY